MTDPSAVVYVCVSVRRIAIRDSEDLIPEHESRQDAEDSFVAVVGMLLVTSEDSRCLQSFLALFKMP